MMPRALPGLIVVTAVAALACSAAGTDNLRKLRGANDAASSAPGHAPSWPEEVWQPVKTDVSTGDNAVDTATAHKQSGAPTSYHVAMTQLVDEPWPAENTTMGEAALPDATASEQLQQLHAASATRNTDGDSRTSPYVAPAKGNAGSPPAPQDISLPAVAQLNDSANDAADVDVPQQEAWQAVLAAQSQTTDSCPIALHDVLFPQPETPGPIAQLLDMSFERCILTPDSSFAFAFGPQVRPFLPQAACMR